MGKGSGKQMKIICAIGNICIALACLVVAIPGIIHINVTDDSSNDSATYEISGENLTVNATIAMGSNRTNIHIENTTAFDTTYQYDGNSTHNYLPEKWPSGFPVF